MRCISLCMSEVPCVKVGQRMIEEANICVIWTYSYHVDNSWDEVGCECNDECLKQNYEENINITYILVNDTRWGREKPNYRIHLEIQNVHVIALFHIVVSGPFLMLMLLWIPALCVCACASMHAYAHTFSHVKWTKCIKWTHNGDALYACPTIHLHVSSPRILGGLSQEHHFHAFW